MFGRSVRHGMFGRGGWFAVCSAGGTVCSAGGLSRILIVRILYLSQRVPYPPNRGDKITTWRNVDYLRRNHDVTCVAFAHDEGDLKAARDLRDMGIKIETVDLDMKAQKLRSLPMLFTRKPLTLGVYGSRKLQAVVDRLMPGIDLAIAYSSSMGAFILPHKHKKRIQYVVELDSDKWAQYEGFTKPPMKWVYGREARTLRRFEQVLCSEMDMNVLVTPLEQRIFQEAVPGAPSLVMRNGVDLDLFNPGANAPEPGHLVFTGVMDYFPNTDGCDWFAREILPAVQAEVPGAHFSIVGSAPTDAVRALGELPGVTVTGFVDETRDWLARADLAVAPLRIARGIQNKVLEAMAMGLPVVGTTHATQGVDGKSNRDYVVADTKEAQIQSVVRLLRDRKEALALGKRARTFVEEKYRWEDVLAPLGELISSLEKTSK